jgi:predicted nuclease of predicted toxin-antitoxin system
VLRFHLDENVDPAIADGLRRRAIDVTTSLDAQLIGAGDEDHIHFALGDNRVVITHDDDFLRLAASGEPHAGIAYCRAQTRSIGEIIDYLALMDGCLTSEDMAGRIEFI